MPRPTEEIERIKYFKEVTEKRLKLLKDKRHLVGLSRAEIIELDMCEGDLKRAEEALKNE